MELPSKSLGERELGLVLWEELRTGTEKEETTPGTASCYFIPKTLQYRYTGTNRGNGLGGPELGWGWGEESIVGHLQGSFQMASFKLLNAHCLRISPQPLRSNA